MATKISNILVRIIVFFAVIGILFLLTMYNAKLLYTLNWFKTENQLLDRLVIIIAAVAYSLGSIAVVIWYNPTKKQDESKLNFKFRYSGSILLKLIFVIIDGIHVYVYNNTHIEDLAKWLSPVYAVQTSFILFFIGTIVNDIIKSNQTEQSQLFVKENEINELKSQLKNLRTDFKQVQSDLQNKNFEVIRFESEIENLHTQINIKETEIKKLQTYRKAFLKSEKSRILKKKLENRTEKELKTLKDAEVLL
ncbi:MAG: hypothetical protein L3J56_13430 [Bacteroidales bacterium]|nr:hypothetical protein [Bacteroidales bacterium]